MLDRHEGAWKAWLQVTFPPIWEGLEGARRKVNHCIRANAGYQSYYRYLCEWLDRLEWAIKGYEIACNPCADGWLPPDGVPEDKRIAFYDIETQRSASEVKGWHNAHEMGISAAGVFTHPDRELRFFGPDQTHLMVELLCSCDVIIGFNNRKFDNAVIRGEVPHAPFDEVEIFDIMVDVQKYIHRRPSLAQLARGTLDSDKLGDGLDALRWWKEGKLHLLLSYLAVDVQTPYEIFVIGCRDGVVHWKPPRTKGVDKIRPVDTSHWPSLVERSDWAGQMDLFSGETHSPILKNVSSAGEPVDERASA